MSSTPQMRFPCGHEEPQGSVRRRLQLDARFAWVRCRRCNVVALVIEQPPPVRPGRSREGRRAR